MNQSVKYVIISPVRDEERHIKGTLNSVTSQGILPAEWIIVDDGSTDRTPQIIDEYAADYPWIRIEHRPNRGVRKSGGGVIEAFYAGYGKLKSQDWDFIVKLDGDLTFSSDYFEKCFEHFQLDPTLGIGGGIICHNLDGVHEPESNPQFHVRGATKIYKRACWEAIGGLWPAPGWDAIDEVKANMLGWKSFTFNELRLLHHRLTGAADGILRDRIKHGMACYISGYHPLFVAASCVSRLAQKPYLTGSAAICYGYIKGYWTRAPRVRDAQFIKYIRTQQLRRLWGMESIWK
jgi:poly-beta-1,6-N-acetyl-D-glucosamine synthase